MGAQMHQKIDWDMGWRDISSCLYEFLQMYLFVVLGIPGMWVATEFVIDKT